MTEKNAPAGLSLAGLKNGQEAWGWAWDWPPGIPHPLSDMAPVHGILAGSNSGIGDPARGPGWFVPFRKNTRKPAWTKAVRVESVTLHDSRDDAVSRYNAAVQATVRRFNDMSRLAQTALIKTPDLGFGTDGYLMEYPVMRADLSGDFTAAYAATGKKRALRPDHGDWIMPWSEFAALVDRGDLNHHDGVADLLLDGQGSENVLVDIWRAMVYVPDSFLIPFDKIETVFAGHGPQAIWFPK